jgi:hypothetical protein
MAFVAAGAVFSAGAPDCVLEHDARVLPASAATAKAQSKRPPIFEVSWNWVFMIVE